MSIPYDTSTPADRAAIAAGMSAAGLALTTDVDASAAIAAKDLAEAAAASVVTASTSIAALQRSGVLELGRGVGDLLGLHGAKDAWVFTENVYRKGFTTYYGSFTGIPSATFARSGAASARDVAAFGATGPAVRIFADNVPQITGLGLRSEPARTGLLEHYNDAANAYWTKQGCTITADAATAPDGTVTADAIVEDGTTDKHGYFRSGTTTGTTDGEYSATWLVKPSGRTYWRATALDSPVFSVVFNLATGVVTSQSGGGVGAILPLANGFFELTVTWTKATGANQRVVLWPQSDDTTVTYAGTNGLVAGYVWGPDCQLGKKTSMIPATSAAVTRAVPLAQDTGALPAAFKAVFTLDFMPASGATAVVVDYHDGTDNNRVLAYVDGTSGHLKVDITTASVAQASLDLGAVAAGVEQRMAVRLATNDVSGTLNGAPCVTDTSVTLPVTTTRAFASSRSATNPLYGLLAEVLEFGTAPADSALQGLAEATPLPVSPVVGEAWVSATGSDITGTGTEAAPFASFPRAQNYLARYGSLPVEIKVAISGGVLLGSVVGQIDYAINPRLKVSGRQNASWSASSIKKPVIKYGTKLTGVTKTGGQTKVYQTTISLTGTPNYIWQDDYDDPDTDTSSVPAENHPLLRGRRYRSWCCKVKKTVATTLAAALAEIDGATLPLCFYDAGVLYFSAVGGGSGITPDFYVATDEGLIKTYADAPPAYGEIEIEGLEVRYGGINLKPYRRRTLYDVQAIGAASNTIVTTGGRTTLHRVEATGAGSGVGVTTGDGVNGDYNFFDYWFCYFHDNHQDGESSHGGSRGEVFGCVSEYNHGGNYTPASGCNVTYRHCVSRKGGVVTWWYAADQRGGFYNIGTATNPPDYVGKVVCEDCIDYGSRSAFFDQGTQPSHMTCRRCVSVDATYAAFWVQLIEKCEYSGSPPNVKRVSAPGEADTVVAAATTVVT